MELKPSMKPTKNQRVLTRRLDDGCVVYDPEAGRVHILNLYAALVWEYCDDCESVDALVRTITNDLAELPGDHAKQVRATLEDCLEKGLLVEE
jgi:PqqD family protein of HPr-rel-A system